MFIRDWPWDRYLWMGREGSTGHGEREIAKQTQWRLPQGMRELEWSLESRPEVGGVG